MTILNTVRLRGEVLRCGNRTMECHRQVCGEMLQHAPYQYGGLDPIKHIDVNGDSLLITHRTGFYNWFQSETSGRGFETQWTGAAPATVGKLKNLLGWGETMTGYSNDEIKSFVISGNKMIMDDVWNGLQSLYDGPVLKGTVAKSWDSNQLYNEQIVINDLYWGLSNKSLNILEDSIKQKWNAPASKISTGPAFKGSLLNTNDRYKYGMKLMGY